MTELFRKALDVVIEEYKNDVRKSSGFPAIHHPLGVCELVMGAGGDEDTCIGGLFHDLAEDKGGEDMLKRISSEFNPRIASIVRDCSDVIPENYTLKGPWVERKVAHINHIQDCCPESCLVLAADTLHNTRDHIRGYKTYGMKWFENFRANVFLTREISTQICAISTIWYLETKGLALNQRSESVLTYELLEAVNELDLILNIIREDEDLDLVDEIHEHMSSKYNL